MASLFQILVDSSLVPGFVWILLYAIALLGGIAVGVADRRGLVNLFFLKLGIDLAKRGDIWSSQFRDAENVRVYLRDGTLLTGWSEYYSTDKSQRGRELYLTYARVWSIDESEWWDIDGVRGILLHGDEITRIEFLDSSDEGDKETAQ